MSSRSCTIERHHASLTLRSISDAERAVVVGGAEAAVDLGRREDEAPATAQVDDLVEQLGIGLHGLHRLVGHGATLPAVDLAVRIQLRRLDCSG